MTPVSPLTDAPRIGVIGLGYVGLPLALEFGKNWPTLGYDINAVRISELRQRIDQTREIDSVAFQLSQQVTFSNLADDLATCTVFIVTVPTPIDKYKCPDLRALLAASRLVGTYLKQGDVVIYESTVYPGCTEDDCVPELEQASGLRYNVDFFCGYSPERINPGDKERTLINIQKITSGSTPETAQFVDQLYSKIIVAGTYQAPSIKVAEAAKAIENAQRDVNISFVNELALIFDRLNIDTMDVLEAAGTKWNFLKFRPGLVGGHCISVDPYYLSHKAESVGYHPQVILSGRRVNDDMPIYVANKLVKAMIRAGIPISGASVLLLGITFKENCPDVRNTKVADIYHELIGFGINVTVHDPWALADEVARDHKITLASPLQHTYDAVVLAVAHDSFRQLDIRSLCRHDKAVVYDLKSVLDRNLVTMRI
ncbi:nucleotide sugar dehydrogenase [Fibrella forsythiae]|uniref:Nucleotide sugar dehydrogenase n=1 Tax=Fibrella forsythiae TaxID=2817061 RepID=A0ABS3JQQ4_9BACT|nr:nucleotide sugar dehydrogenase [Fibrella forsythiae]MBO0952327.1 nucleotide sugar dehydrogenase [Fibrella forsythiae]